MIRPVGVGEVEVRVTVAVGVAPGDSPSRAGVAERAVVHRHERRRREGGGGDFEEGVARVDAVAGGVVQHHPDERAVGRRIGHLPGMGAYPGPSLK